VKLNVSFPIEHSVPMTLFRVLTPQEEAKALPEVVARKKRTEQTPNFFISPFPLEID